MRGKDYWNIHIFAIVGITPAYAGKSEIHLVLKLLSWDHPRLCGEKGEKRTEILLNVGSPPPMRGKVYEQAKTIMCPRITPAYAGKSQAVEFYT